MAPDPGEAELVEGRIPRGLRSAANVARAVLAAATPEGFDCITQDVCTPQLARRKLRIPGNWPLGPSLAPAQKTPAISALCATNFRRVTRHSRIRRVMRRISRPRPAPD